MFRLLSAGDAVRIIRVEVRTWAIEVRQDRRRARIASVLLDVMLWIAQRIAGRWGAVEETATRIQNEVA